MGAPVLTGVVTAVDALRLESCIEDAQRSEDKELVDLFTRAQADSKKGAEQAQELLKARL